MLVMFLKHDKKAGHTSVIGLYIHIDQAVAAY
jgi:hypothetical protein